MQTADSAVEAEFDLTFEVAQGEAKRDTGAGSTSMGHAMRMAVVASVPVCGRLCILLSVMGNGQIHVGCNWI